MKSSLCAAALVSGMVLATSAGGADTVIRGFDGKAVSSSRIDREAARMMAAARVQGLAMAVMDDGKVVFVRSWGRRNVEKKLPLQTDTIMYGASLTKFAFAYMVMQLVDEGKLDLDRPIAAYLPKPLPEYPFYAVAARRRALAQADAAHPARATPAGWPTSRSSSRTRRCGSTSIPGSRYAYSGEGIILLQFVLETGLGLKVGDEMQRRVFDRFGMTRTSMMWRADFAGNLADGYGSDGAFEAHDERSDAARGRIDGHDHRGLREVSRRLLARRGAVGEVARGDDRAADGDRHAEPVSDAPRRRHRRP